VELEGLRARHRSATEDHAIEVERLLAVIKVRGRRADVSLLGFVDSVDVIVLML
jgi:hypothetical protein